MGEWPLVPIGELCELYDGPHQTASLSPGGPIVYLNVGDIRGGRIELALSGEVTEETARQWSRRVEPLPGDVVFGYEAKVGEAAMLTQAHRWCLGRRVGLLRPRSGRIDSRYLTYAWYSKHFQDTLRAHRIGGTTIESIRLTDLPSWTIHLPSIDVQRRIAGILGALDDKIELNRRTSETLETAARAIFKSWFIDDAPAGGTVRGLDEVARFLNGLALQRFPPTADSSLPVIKIAQLHSGDTRGADRASADLPAAYIVRDGDVLFSWSGSLECVLWAGGRGALNQHLFKVTSADFPKWFYYLWIHRHLADFREIAAGKATTMGHIQRHHLADAKVNLPPQAVLAAADRALSPLIERTVLARVEARTLMRIRDSLLSELLSGELRIGDADQAAEAVSA